MQRKYTGGTVLHLYMTEPLIHHRRLPPIRKRALNKVKLPYITITPTFSICPVHAYLGGSHKFRPKCDDEIIARKAATVGRISGAAA